jgi:hypothetical protein
MKIQIEVEVSHVTGKFVSKDEIADELISNVEGIGDLYVDEAEYTIEGAEVL